MADYATLIPVNVLTGFLGSGKTTLLQRLLADPAMGNAAVLINEFGEVGLDHHLLQSVVGSRLDENTVLLSSGCLCCTIRGDLTQATRELHSKRERGLIPRFDRLVVETTGLADPVPIVYTVLAEPVLQHHFRLGNVVTTVDAVNGAGQLDAYPESVKQAAMADRIVLTKSDLAAEAVTANLVARLRALNRGAPLLDAQRDVISADLLLQQDVYDVQGKAAEMARWLDEQRLSGDGAWGAGHTAEHRPHDPSRHDPNLHDPNVHDGPSAGSIRTFALTWDTPLDWTGFGVWLTLLLHSHGEQVLRVKGILNVAGQDGPVAVHGVQHIVHPPTHLPTWPDAERRSRVVFIVRDLPPERVQASLAAFCGLPAQPTISGG